MDNQCDNCWEEGKDWLLWEDRGEIFSLDGNGEEKRIFQERGFIVDFWKEEQELVQ